MRIVFVQPYDETRLFILSYHPNYESIPDSQKVKMCDWRPLPDDYVLLPGINLMNIETGEITNITVATEPEVKSEQDVKIEKLESAVDSIIISLLGV